MSDQVLVLTPQEDQAIRKAGKTVYRLMLRAVEKIIAEDDFSAFDLPPKLISEVKRSWAAKEPVMLGRFDATFTPEGGIKFYELNISYAGLFYETVMKSVRKKDIFPDDVSNDTTIAALRGAWRKAAAHIAGRETLFLSSYRMDIDVDLLLSIGDETLKNQLKLHSLHQHRSSFFLAVKSLEEIKSYAFRGNDDSFGVEHYRKSPTTFVTPPAWSLLLDNKAIWVHLYRMFPDCPYLIPSSFNLNDFKSGGALKHTNPEERIVAKVTNSCSSDGLYILTPHHLKKKENLIKGEGRRYIFQAYYPEQRIHYDSVDLRLFLVDGTIPLYGFPSLWHVVKPLPPKPTTAKTRKVRGLRR